MTPTPTLTIHAAVHDVVHEHVTAAGGSPDLPPVASALYDHFDGADQVLDPVAFDDSAVEFFEVGDAVVVFTPAADAGIASWQIDSAVAAPLRGQLVEAVASVVDTFAPKVTIDAEFASRYTKAVLEDALIVDDTARGLHQIPDGRYRLDTDASRFELNEPVPDGVDAEPAIHLTFLDGACTLVEVA